MKNLSVLFFLLSGMVFGFDLQDEVSKKHFNQMGLDKLNERELNQLNHWIEKRFFREIGDNKVQFEITKAQDEELFMIENKLFRARTYCPDWVKGDVVVFESGDMLNCQNVLIKNLTQNSSCALSCK